MRLCVPSWVDDLHDGTVDQMDPFLKSHTIFDLDLVVVCSSWASGPREIRDGKYEMGNHAAYGWTVQTPSLPT